MIALIGCESSNEVTSAFRAVGIEAYSCDLLPSQTGSPWHIQGDVRDVLRQRRWDLLIAHPSCTYLCNSGVGRLRHVPPNPSAGVLYGEARWQAMREAAALFTELLEAPVARVALENPVMHGHAGIRKADQYIQPYQFGDDASKRTGLWLRGLPALELPPAASWVQPRIVDGKPRWSNQTDSGQNKLTPSADRWQLRSNTYPGIAAAMAAQWGKR